MIKNYNFSKIYFTLIVFVFCFTSTIAFAQPANDNCSGAIQIIPGYTCVATTGDVSGATQSQVGCTGTADDDVWFYFTATSTKHTITVVASSSFDAILQVFTGSCGSLVSSSCNDNSGTGGTETAQLTGLTIGQKYYYRVYDYYSGTPTTSTFTTCVTTPPVNDDCTNAITVVPDGACVNGDGTYATQSAAGCTGTANDDVWYKFTATRTTHFITVNASSGYNPVVELYLNCSTKFTPAFCNDASYPVSASGSASVSGLTVGITYYYRVYDSAASNPANMTFTTCIKSPVANDECANSQVVTAGAICNPVSGDVGTATSSLTAGYEDVWYSFVANSATQYITVTAGGNFDPVIDVYATCPGVNAAIKTLNTSTTTTESGAVTGLIPGTTYYYRVYHSSTTNPTQTAFTTCVMNPAPNDECTNAVTMTPSNTCIGVSGDVGNATGLLSATTEDVWYKFVATSTTHFIEVDAAGGNFNPVIEVYTTCPAVAPSLKKLDATTGTSEIGYLTGLTIGTTYYYRVYNSSTTNPTVTAFTTCVTNPVSNDECAGAKVVTSGVTCTPVAGDVVYASALLTANIEDVWYSFVATSVTEFINVTATNDFNPVIQVYSGTCASLTSLATINNTTTAIEDGYVKI